MKQEIKVGKEAREKLVSGINKIAQPVSASLGPAGRNAVFLKDGNLVSTKDGVSIAKAISQVEDPNENLGIELIKQAAIKTCDNVGDGTTTSTLLAQNIINKGVQYLNNKSNATDLKKGIELATKKLIYYIRENLSEEISNEEQLKQIATISSNNDVEIGTMVSTALSQVGRQGIVHIEESKTGDTYLEKVEGVQFNKGYLSHYFVTNNDTMTGALNEPYVLLVNKNINQVKDLLPILEKISSEGKSLLIIAEGIEGEALATLIVNKARGSLKVAAVKAPDFGERRKLFMEDIAIITKGEVVDADKGMRLDKFNMDWLGKCRLATITKDKTTIIDGDGDEEAITNRMSEIEAQIEVAETPFAREKLQERLAQLSDGVSIIHVGGNTETEIKERKDRVEDALHATKAAIDQGILPGGGAALIYAMKGIEKDLQKEINKMEGSFDIWLGAKIVLDTCKAPMSKILENAGYNGDDIYENIKLIEKSSKKWMGYNLKKRKHENLKESGVIDATLVTVTALENASSVAGTLLLTEACISDIIEKSDESGDLMKNYGGMF